MLDFSNENKHCIINSVTLLKRFHFDYGGIIHARNPIVIARWSYLWYDFHRFEVAAPCPAGFTWCHRHLRCVSWDESISIRTRKLAILMKNTDATARALKNLRSIRA